MTTPIPNAVPADFRVGNPGAGGLDCVEFNSVTHVTHLMPATRVVADGRIRADLVFDTSKLNKKRIRVVWLSPNQWVNGYRYGGTGFQFNWRSLIQEFPEFFWVEAMDYSPKAPRILLSRKDRTGLGLTRYDPRNPAGPWWWDQANDKHYFNMTFTLEIMVDADLPIGSVEAMKFVQHHASFCCVKPNNPGACPEHGKGGDWHAARLLCRLMSRSLTGVNSHLVRPTTRSRLLITGGTEDIADILSSWPTSYSGPIAAGTGEAAALAQAVVAALAVNDGPRAAVLMNMFSSKADFFDSMRAELASFLGGGINPSHLNFNP